MLSTFAGIEIGKRGVIAHTQGLITVGHNLNNAEIEGYSRQRVEFKASDPIYLPGLNREQTPGHLGQGLEVQRIERIRDMLLEDEIIRQTTEKGYWNTMDRYLLMLEQVLNEPTEQSIRFLMDKYWESWQELSINPSEMGARQAVLERGQTLIDGIHHAYDRLRAVRDMLEDDITGKVKQINTFIKEIAAINVEIEKAKAMGDNPNDLLDRRDLVIERLSEEIDTTVVRTDPDELIIYANGRHIVQGSKYLLLDTIQTSANEGYSQVVWQHNQELAEFKSGNLAALVELRDIEARGEIQKLDLMTMNFIDMVNAIHKKGYGLNNKTGIDFFKEYPFITNALGNYDSSGDGVLDSSYIFRITGIHSLNLKDQIGIQGTITLNGTQGPINIDYYDTDTVEDVIYRINFSGAEVVALLDEEGRLSLKATPAGDTGYPDFVIRNVEDSGQFLAGYAGLLIQSGAAGAYNWAQADAVLNLRQDGTDFAVAPLAHPAAWIEINQELVNEPVSVVSGFEENGRPRGYDDGSAALAISQLRHKPVMIGQTLTFDNYFADVVATIGLKGEQATKMHETQNMILKNSYDMRQSISGVNIDEELANMMKFQHGYNAAARFITTFDEMLDLIINRMGV